MFAKTVVETLNNDGDLFFSIRNALKLGSKYGTESSIGKTDIRIDKDSPTIYGTRF